MDLDRDEGGLAFLSLEDTRKIMGKDAVDASLYEEVFNADIEPVSLEELFVQFNSDGHPLRRGRSVSVSDVVVIEPEGIPFLVGEIKGSSPLGGSFMENQIVGKSLGKFGIESKNFKRWKGKETI